MTIEDHYQRRREHRQRLLAEAQEQRFARSGDPRIQKAPPPYRALFSMISRWIVWLQSEPANPIEYAKSVQRPERKTVRANYIPEDIS